MGPANYVDNASLKLKAGGADCPFAGKSGENVEEKVWYGVPRCPTVFLGVSRYPTRVLWCFSGFLLRRKKLFSCPTERLLIPL